MALSTGKSLTIYVDGGSRGNPGHAASGYVISEGKNIIKEDGEYLGQTTNNVAEYTAVLLALKKIKALYGKEKIQEMKFNFFSDSLLLVSQMNGVYKIEHEGLQKLFMEIWNLKIDFGPITFTHVPREQNKGADAVVNKILDQEGSRLF